MLGAISIYDDIEEEALDLQRDLWDRQSALWPGEKVTRLDVCDPWMAAYVLGFKVQEGWIGGEGGKFGYKFGGFLNRSARVIGISDQMIPRTQRFTLAHEVGHVLRHRASITTVRFRLLVSPSRGNLWTGRSAKPITSPDVSWCQQSSSDTSSRRHSGLRD